MKSVIIGFFVVFGAGVGLGFGEDCKGCVPLDTLSFNKVLLEFSTVFLFFSYRKKLIYLFSRLKLCY